MIKRKYPPQEGKWALPGGKIELGERMLDAASRELYEECAVRADMQEVLGAVDVLVKDGTEKMRFHYVLVVVKGAYRYGQAAPSEEVAAARWVPLDEIGSYDLTAATEVIFEKYVL